MTGAFCRSIVMLRHEPESLAAAGQALAPVAKRQRLPEITDAVEASFRLGEYLEGKRSEPPWDALGLTRAPVMAGAAPH